MKSLAKKLVKVMASLKAVKKTGYNDFHKYAYATEADVLDEVRDALAKENIFIFQSVEGVTKESDLTTVMIQYTFVDGDTGETMNVKAAGQGKDSGDKGIYKAQTGANKYFLLKNFLIPTGDDPEASDETGKSTAPKVTVNSSSDTEATKKKSFARKDFSKSNTQTATGDDL